MKSTETKTSIQSAKNYITSVFSIDHKIIDVEGIQDLPGISEPNVNDVTWESAGRQGKFHTEKELTDFPCEFEQYCKNVHTQDLRAVIRNQNPNDDDLEVDFNEENPYLDIISIRKEKAIDGKFYWKDSVIHLNVQGMTDNSPITLSKGDVKTAYAGMSERAIAFEKPLAFMGWGANVDLTEQATPDNTAKISGGGFWGRRDAGTYNPEKLYVAEQNTVAINTITADPRYDAVVAYKSGDKYTDTSILIVEGTENAAPVKPSDSTIETEVDVVLTGALWCVLGYILVDELATVVVNDADISYKTQATFTYDKTALEMKSKSIYFPFQYAVKVSIGGTRKENKCGVTSESATNLVLTNATDKMVEIWIKTEPYEAVC